MKNYIVIVLVVLSYFVQGQTPNNCNGAVPGCTLPNFAIAPTNNATNIVDFTAGSISNPSTNPNPGNQGCLLTGETSSTFITINVISTGTLAWSIIGSNGGCFDWIMWPYIDAATTCSAITGNTLPPVACNWNGTCNGNTGMAPAGQLPPGGSPSSYEAPLNVTAGQQFLLCLSNFSGTSQSVNMNFFGSANVACSVSAPNQTICQGNTTLVTIATPGMTNPQFTWLVTNGVSNTSGGTNVSVSPTVTTTYKVKVVQPASGSTAAYTDTAVFTITVVPPPTPNAGIDKVVCFGSPFQLNGSISNSGNTPSWQTITTGVVPTPTVNFSPNFNSLNPTVSVSQPGLYKFILRENNSVCGMRRDTVEVHVIQLAQTVSFTSPSCQGLSDGIISINNPQASEYSFDNGLTWQSGNALSGFSANTYTVCSRNSIGCQTCSNVTITDTEPISISVSPDTTICKNGAAVLAANAFGGSSFIFHWSNTTINTDTQTVSPDLTSTYSVYVENENGCVSDSKSILVNVYPDLEGTITEMDTTCPGYPVNLYATASGGNSGPYSFIWSTGENQVGFNSYISVNPITSQDYTVSIRDGCESTPLLLSSSVFVAGLPEISAHLMENNICEPAIFQLSNTTDPIMVDQVFWQISDGETFIENNIQTAPLSAGMYDVQMIVVTPLGCVDSITFINYLIAQPKPVVNFLYSPNPVFIFNTEVILTNYTANAVSYEWSIEGGFPSYSTQKNVKTRLPEGMVGIYPVQLIATSSSGCVDTLVKNIVVFQDVILYAPNAFTPDGDEFNQTWRVYIEGIDKNDFELLIYNRWGEIIWESHDPIAEWDGTYDGKPVGAGTYTWVIRAKSLLNDEKFVYNGSLTILK